MRTLVTINLYRYFRAHYGAISTAGTFFAIGEDNRQIAAGVQFTGQGYHALRAEGYAKLAALAKLLVDINLSLHSKSVLVCDLDL